MSPSRHLLALLFALIAVPAAAQPVVRLPAADVPLRARPSVVYTVGAADGEDWEAFANVAALAFDSRDNLYVLDQGNARVLVFDAAGHYVRTIGRRGGGPGEFSAAMGLAVVADDLVVSDMGRKVFTIFGSDGRLIRSVPQPAGSLPTGRLSTHPRGGVAARAIGNPASRAFDALAEDAVIWFPLDDGAPSRLLSIQTREQRQAESRARGNARQLVFAPGTRFTLLSNGGLAVANTADYAIRIIAPTGAIARQIARPLEPRRVNARDREIARERLARYSRPGGLYLVGPQSGPMPASIQAQAAAVLQDVDFARVMPVIQGLATDAMGNLWIQRTGLNLDTPGLIDVVTAQGRYLGTLSGIELPVAFSRKGRGAYISTDDEGIQRVVVLRIPDYHP